MAVVEASHNHLLRQLSGIIREPFRMALAVTSRLRSAAELGLDAHHALLAALRQRDPMAARRAADEVVGLAMLAVEEAIRSGERAVTQ
jgi:DNA-binding FadR family transcriptional regulator